MIRDSLKECIKALIKKNLGDYHNLYVQSDTSLRAEVFENFRSQCIEICELNPVHFLTAPGLAWKAYMKISGIELELLTDADVLLMVEQGVRGGICQEYVDMQKQLIGI